MRRRRAEAGAELKQAQSLTVRCERGVQARADSPITRRRVDHQLLRWARSLDEQIRPVSVCHVCVRVKQLHR